jgi:hypothetical protein
MADDDEDAWLSAGGAIFGSSEPDIRPLVAMFRSGKPVPPGIADMLAELIDPNGGGYLYFKLKLENTETQRNNMKGDLHKIAVATEYEKRLAKGERSQVIVDELAEKNQYLEKLFLTTYRPQKAF